MSDQVYTTDKGLRIYIAGDYGDDCVEIYFADDAGEIMMWTLSEWEDEPSLVAKIAEALCIGWAHGPDGLRDQFHNPKPEPGDETYNPWGGWTAP